MAKANIVLPDGTKIVIDGNAEEITKVLQAYQTPSKNNSNKPPKKNKTQGTTSKKSNKIETEGEVSRLEIRNKILDCGESETIEEKILNNSDQLRRVLLPLYVLKKYFEEPHKLIVKEIVSITTGLGIPIARQNVNKIIRKKTNMKFFIKHAGEGRAKELEISRKGLQNLETILKED
ncbi:MAG: hypothetical protein V3R64_07430 [Sphingomonadales bacterium]